MRALQTNELSRMKVAQEEGMMDLCQILTYSETLDAINHPVPSWVDGPMTACGLDPTGGQEVRGADKIIVRWDAMIRLPLTTSFNLRDRIKIMRRFGQLVSDAIIYEIIGPADIGPSGLVIPLRKVVPST